MRCLPQAPDERRLFVSGERARVCLACVYALVFIRSGDSPVEGRRQARLSRGLRPDPVTGPLSRPASRRLPPLTQLTPG
jgi:hypothetical protein